MELRPLTPPTPFYFGPELSLFGWYHEPQGLVARSVGVVLCPPLGNEFLTSYWAFRHLAERLSSLGFAVLRVEYYATGNSAGSPDDDHVTVRWLDSIATAIEELKSRGAVDKVVLGGMRMGATLAAVAAKPRDDIAGLALWEPTSNGRLYVRQMQMLAMANERVEERYPAQGLESAGFYFSKATVDALASMQLLKMNDLAKVPTLVLSRDDLPVDSKLAAHLTQLGVPVTQRTFEGYVTMMDVPTHEAELPEGALSELTSWLSSLDGGTPAAISRSDRTSFVPREQPPALLQRSVRAGRGAGPLVQETAVRFGEGLFGILTADKTRDPSKPGIILLNTGTNAHIGQHGMYVPLSRDWAAEGFGVLRFDVAGVGASPARVGEPENVSVTPQGREDILAAVSFMQERGFDRVVLIGLCSGGYNAVHAAAQGAPVAGIIAVNASLQFKPHAITLDPVWNKIEMEVLLKNLVSPQKWARFFSGSIRYRYVFGIVLNRFRLWGSAALPKQLRSVLIPDEAQTKPADMASLVKPGVRTHLLFSRGDPGHTYFEEAVGDALPGLLARDGFELEVLDDADHLFLSGSLQKRLIGLLNRALSAHVDPSRALPSTSEPANAQADDRSSEPPPTSTANRSAGRAHTG